jgi:predicted RNase H-like HicB family nuclease
MSQMELEVVVHRDSESGSYWAEVVQLPGCFASGHSRDELMTSLEEAIELYLEDSDPQTMISSDRVEGVERYRVGKDFKLLPAS